MLVPVALVVALGIGHLAGTGSLTGPSGADRSAVTAPQVPTPVPPEVPASLTEGSPAEATLTGSEAAGASAGGGRTTALLLLGGLQTKGRAPRTGYDRSLFGQTWADTDRNGCDTRNDVLRRDLTGVFLREGSGGCVVLAGTLIDPFSAGAIAFQRGDGTSDAVQIDHVVPLSDAWQKGAQQWTPQRRVAFANDPLNLLAVDGPLNSQKSDGDAATWLPPAVGFRCAYVARQVAVKAKFGLWVTAGEGAAIAGILAGCPQEPAPIGTAPTESDVGADVAAPTTSPPAAPAAPAAPGSAPCDPSYPAACIPPVALVGDLDCGGVTERDFAVLPPDPHGFDRDGDGLGCTT